MLFLIMFYYYLYCILLCFIAYYPTPFPQAFGTLAPMPQCQLMLPVPEVPLAGVWGSLPLSSRMYLCIMYALLQQSYVSMFLCMYLCRYQCDRSKGCVFIDFQGLCCRSHSGPHRVIIIITTFSHPTVFDASDLWLGSNCPAKTRIVKNYLYFHVKRPSHVFKVT